METGNTRIRKAVLLVTSLAFVSAVLCAGFAEIKRQALGYATVDYVFYAGSLPRLTDPSRLQELPINPTGYNVLRFFGSEGEIGIQQSIHFEPVRYLESLMLGVTGSFFVIFLATALVSVSPVLYMAYHALRGRGSMRALFLVSFITLANPLLYLAVANDLRPFTLIPPLFLLAYLSIHLQRSRIEQIALFSLLFFVREEAIVLIPFLILASAVRARSVRFVIPHIGVYLVSAFLLMRYFISTGYENNSIGALQNHHGLVIGFVTFLLVVAGVLSIRLREHLKVSRIPAIGFGFLALLMILQVVVSMRSWPMEGAYEKLAYHPYVSMVWIVLLVLALELNFTGHRTRLVSIVAIFFLTAHTISPLAPLRQALLFHNQKEEAEVVFVQSTHLPQDAVILGDLYTLQALTHTDTAYAYERLPSHLASQDERRFPQNKERLASLLNGSITHVFMERGRVIEVVPPEKLARLIELGGNERFVLYEVRP